MATPVVEPPKSTAKRDSLRTTEIQFQSQWQDLHLFNTDAPSDRSLPKFFSTFPYPYMNGRLHLGHFFSFSKVEFACGYERLKGKVVLLPFGFHVTGMPIKACADKLKREIEMFGKNFDGNEGSLNNETQNLSIQPSPSNALKKHSKATAKAGSFKYQWEIMKSMGVPQNEIHLFSDSKHWLTYFPPLAIQDLNALGCKIDWRRSFITTEANPFYDSFVRWQFNKLHALSKIKFGERYTIWSEQDGQACMDHDRSSGEGVSPQEYVGIKMLVHKIHSEKFKDIVSNNSALKGKKIYLISATLRPETMYGQTNCFVGIDLEYGLWEINDEDVFICTHRAARNMAFQGFAKVKGQPVCLATVNGSDLIGTSVHAPLSRYDFVFVLPLDHVVANKGTGVVTSVPSDSPDDYAMTRDLKKKSEFYKIDPSWIQGFDPVPIIRTPTYGDMSAIHACELFKISSPKDRGQLDKAKELVYKEGFYLGTMLIGEYHGMNVAEAKPLIRDMMVKSKQAIIYSEPEKDVISRSGDECVVNLCDQWYLDYGEASWKSDTLKLVDQLHTYHPETRNAFKQTLDWLNQWACARSFGLGTRLPWDKQFLIESLSDSTIYMAYYTVAHLLHTDLAGKQPGTLNICPEHMTDQEWEYVFNELSKYPNDSKVPQNKLDQMRAEFTYFYPFDLRVSGKDLLPNHLTFCLYNHACLFPEKHWPKAVRVNGHLLFNSEKMSKSTGTFVTLSEAIERYGADGTRLTIADAGDSIEDANFVEMTANAAILRLYTQREWYMETMENIDTLRVGPYQFADRVFHSRMIQLVRQTEEQYENMNFREALKYGFYELQEARDVYREFITLIGERMHKELIVLFIEIQAIVISPITPHWSDYVWMHALKKSTTILNAQWPTMEKEPEVEVLAAATYLQDVIYSVRTSEATILKKMKPSVGGEVTKKCTILVAIKYPQWQDELIQVLREVYEKTGVNWQGQDLEAIRKAGLMKNKKAMPFVSEIKKQLANVGESAFERGLLFDEWKTIEENVVYIRKSLGYQEVILKMKDDDSLTELEAKKMELLALPGHPALHIEII